MAERPVCPRCGGEISWIESQSKGGRVYYYAVHYLGYTKVGKRVRKKVRKCYLGPEAYEYVSRLHSDLGLRLEGAVVGSKRAVHYLDAFIESLTRVELDRATLTEVLTKLKHLTQRLEEYVRELEREESQREGSPRAS